MTMSSRAVIRTQLANLFFNAWDPSAGLIIDHAPHNPDSESNEHMRDDTTDSQQSVAGSSEVGNADGSEGNQKPA